MKCTYFFKNVSLHCYLRLVVINTAEWRKKVYYLIENDEDKIIFQHYLKSEN